MAECTACPTNYTIAGVAVKVEDCLFDPGICGICEYGREGSSSERWLKSGLDAGNSF